jgi:hypothetical protein
MDQVVDHGAVELQGMTLILKGYGPAVCVVATCKRCFKPRNALRRTGFCRSCERDLDRWAAGPILSRL